MNTLKRRSPLRFLVGLTFLAAGCGSDDDNQALRIFKGAAIREGVVTGFVIDDETELPVRAEVLVGGTPVRAAVNGSFEAPVTAGRVRVEVRQDGYLKTFRDVAVGGKALPMPFKIALRAPKKAVTKAGGRVSFREAFLDVPAAAYGDGVEVSLTYLNRVRIAAIASSPQFIDNDGIPRRAVALVDLASDQPPAVAVRARVPVPADATMETVSGFAIDGGGQWTTPIAPTFVGDGFAEFTFSGDTQIGVAVDVRRADGKRLGYLVTERGQTGAAQGDLLSGNDDVVTGSRGAAIVDPRGSRVEMAPGTRARVAVPSSDMSVASRTAAYAGQVDVTAGRARVVVPTAPSSSAGKPVTMTIKGNAGSFEAKGTAFTVTTCGPPTSSDLLEVVEGTVTAVAGTSTIDVLEGETAIACTKCKPGEAPACLDEAPDAGTGGGGNDASAPAPADGGADAATTPATDAPLVDPFAPADASAADAGAAADGPAGAADMAAPQPPPPDAAVKLDAPPVDTAVPQPDAAIVKVDTATAPPPDAATPQPDLAAPRPDVAAPQPDLAAPPPDMAFDTTSLGSDASLPFFSIAPTSQDFGSVTIGATSAPVNFTITNTGDLPSDVPTIETTGNFAVSANGCINAVPADTSCVVGVVFSPVGSGGARSGLLRATTSSGSTSGVSLAGTAVSPVPGQFKIEPLSANFDYWPTGRFSNHVTFTLTNTGGTPTSVPKIGFAGTDAADFAPSLANPRNACGTVALPPGGSCTYSVVFAPRIPVGTAAAPPLFAPKSASLQVEGSVGGMVSASLRGVAALAINGLEITPSRHDFGSVKLGDTTGPLTFKIANINTDPKLELRNLVFAVHPPQTPAPEGLVFGTTCALGPRGTPLAPGTSCDLTVTFNPQKTTGPRVFEFRVDAMRPDQITATGAARVDALAIP